MTVGVALVYGLRIAWTVGGLAHDRDPVALLLAGFDPEVDSRGVASDELAGDLVFDIQAGDVASEDAASLERDGFRPSFFQGNVRVFERQGEVRLIAPSARLVIPTGGRQVRAVVDPNTLGERGFVNTTLVIALSIALRHHGLFHLHGGALVRGDGRRVLVLGEGGSGKTTVTLSLLDDGALRLGDDTLFFGLGAGRLQIFGFPRPFHVAPATARAFPGLAVSAASEGDAKSDLPLSAAPGTAASAMGAPHIVLFPRIVGEPSTRVTQLAPTDAFGLALSSSALVAADGLSQKAEQLAALRGLMAGARSFDVELGADWLAAPRRASALIPWEG